MNLLAPVSGAAPSADGATGRCCSKSTEWLDGDVDCAGKCGRCEVFPWRDRCPDADYIGQTGYVGAPVAGAYVRQRSRMWTTSGA